MYYLSLKYLFVRFWKIADTFTGLKLKGHIGHFGKITATDIEGFVELPDGKVSAVLTGLVYRDIFKAWKCSEHNSLYKYCI